MIRPLENVPVPTSAKRRRSSLSHSHVFGSPSLHAADAAALNGLGVDCFARGAVADARGHFGHALSHVAPALSQSLGIDGSRARPEIARRVSVDDSEEGPATPGRASHGPPSAPASPPPPLAASRTEYDEGMHSYNAPLHVVHTSFDGTDCRQSLLPTLLFNLGLAHVAEGDDALATRHFMHALDLLQHRPAPRTPGGDARPALQLEAIPILHTLGYLHHRGHHPKLALIMYSKALTVASAAPPSDARRVALARALNCLGVLFLHMHLRHIASSGASEVLDLLTASLNLHRDLLAKAPASDGEGSLDASRRELATTMNNVGRVQYLRGDHESALSIYAEAYQLRKELLPHDHLDLGASAYNLGQTHHRLGHLDEAMTLYREFHRIATRSLGPVHRDVATILKCMAQIHHERSSFEDAAALYRASLSTAKAALGERHPAVASILNQIGNLHYERADFADAVRAYEEGLATERAALPRHHPNIIVTLTNIAQSHKHGGNLAAALGWYREACKAQRAALGASHPAVAATLGHVAQVHCRMGAFGKALDVYQEVLRMQRECYGDEHVDVAATLNSIGLALFRQGCLSLALDAFEECLRVRRVCLGNQHRDVAVVLYNVATVHWQRGDEDGALARYSETLRVERSALGPDHPDLVATLQHIAKVHRRRGELDVALEYLEEILRIERLHGCGTDGVAVAEVLNTMGDVHLQRAEVRRMMECYAEAMRIFEAAGESPTDLDRRSKGLTISGFKMYSLSVVHPECAAVA